MSAFALALAMAFRPFLAPAIAIAGVTWVVGREEVGTASVSGSWMDLDLLDLDLDLLDLDSDSGTASSLGWGWGWGVSTLGLGSGLFGFVGPAGVAAAAAVLLVVIVVRVDDVDDDTRVVVVLLLVAILAVPVWADDNGDGSPGKSCGCSSDRRVVEAVSVSVFAAAATAAIGGAVPKTWA